ncbi:type II toxin-antitoxin system HicB family antitoxin [Candidatus Poriferisodalis sp.]|uniref:type II toxin-antitoxin system HicB family antitoxin n=1 Tax=Candidatus Poriferisodalis sp. TaxID=3101277 RepID=UPI003AF82F27
MLATGSAERPTYEGRFAVEAVDGTAIVETTGTGYSAYVPDVPGCIAVGETYEETVQQMQEALRYHLEWMREDGDEIPEPISSAAQVEVSAGTD